MLEMNKLYVGSLDVLSIAAIIGAMASYLPPIAAGLSIVWTALRIYETYLNIRKHRNDSDTSKGN